ncbi:RidA family protein [Desulfitobacterium sp. THU1]|uniref:RidA family protein n=1 Tax=Desulfitobacterium sp. THU1 TaxID=3138072 RepID=UPI0031202F3F
MTAEQILIEKYQLELPKPSEPGGLYTPVVQTGNLLFVSGHTPKRDGKLVYQGKLGRDFTIELGQQAAILSILNCLAAIKGHIGELDKIKRIVQVVGYVSSSEGFHDQAKVINGASKLLTEVFGERGNHARAALGTNELPGGAPVEIMCVVEV